MNKTFKTILAVMVMVFGFGFLAPGIALAEGTNEIKVEVWDESSSSWLSLCEDSTDGKCANPRTLFGEVDFLPGDTINRRVKVTNKEKAGESGTEQRVATEAINYTSISDSYNLAHALFIVISKEDGGGNLSDLYGGLSSTGIKYLSEFFQDSYDYDEIYLSNLDNEESVIYNFTIAFDSNADNDDWNQKDGDGNVRTTGFDIVFGLQGTEGSVTPPPTPPNLPSGGGGGAPAGLIIKYESAYEVGDTWAKIKWWTSYNATSRVIYCLKSKKVDGVDTPMNACAFDFSSDILDPVYSLPLYGFESTTSEFEYGGQSKVTYREIELTGLEEEATYEYRAISHASPPTVSRSHTFTTLALADSDDDGNTGNGDDEGGDEDDGSGDGDEGGDTGEGIPPETYQRWVAGATDFIGGALGLSDGEEGKDDDDDEYKEEEDGEVRGAEDEGEEEDSKDDEWQGGTFEEDDGEEKGESIFSRYWWWPFILALLLIIFFFWYRKKKKKEEEIGN